MSMPGGPGWFLSPIEVVILTYFAQNGWKVV